MEKEIAAALVDGALGVSTSLRMKVPEEYRYTMSEDELLVAWDESKKLLEKYKIAEMELRKYIVSRAFPDKHEGTNTKELGNGYQLKAGVKFNYTLDNDNEKVELALMKIGSTGNRGSFIAERLVSWKPSLSLAEYRAIQDEATAGSEMDKSILKEINSILTITEGAPTLEIKEPKGKK
jgi:hypothetical protein